MWFKFLFNLLITLFMAGCAAEVELNFPKPLAPKVVMHGDERFTPDERKQIETAAEVWRQQTSGLANIAIVWDWSNSKIPKSEENHIERLTSGDLEVVMEDCAISEANDLPPCTPTVLAWVDKPGGIHNPDHEPVNMAFIPDRYPAADYFISVALHEFGHLLGMPHSNVVQAVMYPTQGKTAKTCLKPSDLATFCQVNVCDGRKMIPCE